MAIARSVGSNRIRVNSINMKKVVISLLLASMCLAGFCGENPLPRHKEYLKLMEERLSDEDKLMLKKIYEPTLVGVPPENARSYVCIMPDGEIRGIFPADRPVAHISL